MIKEKILSRSVRLMFTGGLILGAQLVSAQEIEKVQKVEVTGTRIPTINVDGPSPVTVLSAKDIKIDGARSVEDLLNNLPQVFADQGGALSNGATGTSTVSLRGLGADRTLVLVNGRRLPSGSVNSTAADLNEVPAGLIKRVDVLTGGAGAVYGAGAVAGVVNFILKDNYEGVELQVNSSGNNHSQHNDVGAVVSGRGFPVPGSVSYDGKVQDASILMGSNFADGKGNATLYFTYKKTDALLQSQRDFSSCALGSSAIGFSCSGSGTPAGGRVALQSGGSSYTNADANGTARKYVSKTDAYNFGPLNYLQRPSEIYGFNAQAHFDINDKVRVYEEFNFHTYNTDAQVAPGGVFYGQQATLSYDNPLLSNSWKSALGLNNPGDTAAVFVGKRNVEGGPRISSITDTSYRNVLGVKGDVGNWHYDAFAQISRVNHQESENNYFSTTRIANALDVVNVNGQAVCRSVVNGSDPNCVPYNMFKTGGVTQAALNYLQVTGLKTGYTQQTVLGANIGSDLSVYGLKTPWSSNGVGVSIGTEQRTEKLVYTPDLENSTGDLAGSGGPSPAVAGSYSVKEAFGEVHIPIAEKLPFIESLDLSGSYRYSEYSTNKTTNTYGLGLEWSPIKQLRLRGSYQVAVRAPTIFDLYSQQAVGLGGPSDDPCSGTTPSASAAQCAKTGVTAAQYGNITNNSANQYQSLTGGNQNVNPEKAKTYTLGLVAEPIKNLSVTIDYFSIKIDNTISTVDPTTALNQCLQTGNPIFCNLVHRDKFGSLWLSTDGYILANTTNIGKVTTSGIDVGGSYIFKLNTLGSLNFGFNGTYLNKLTTENVPGLGAYDCKGYFGSTCGTPNPEWRHKFRTTWATPWKVEVSGTWRHFSSVNNDALNPSPLLAGSVNPIEATLGARDYFDLYAAYPLTKTITISGGINNLFDKDPPIASTNATAAAGSANGNTYPQVYDSYGRKLFINLTAKF